MRYKFLEHTADIGLKVWGKNREELFANAAYGLTEILIEGKVEEKEKVIISLKADTIDELFHDWLSEINYFFLCKEIIFHNINVQVSYENDLKAVCYGEKYNPKIHSCITEIKAITYHQLYVKFLNDQWTAQVYFDL